MNFDEFFSKIPSVPLRTICKNLKTEQKIPLSLYSPHWRDAIKFYQSPEKASLKLSITDKNVNIELESWVVPTSGIYVRAEQKHFKIQFAEITDKDNSDIEFSDNSIKITSPSIEPMAHDFIRPLFSMFSSLELHDFSLKLTEKSPDSTISFMLSLPCYLYLYTTFQWPKQSIDFWRLRALLRTVMFTIQLNMDFEFDRVVEEFEFELQKLMLQVKIQDARCFPGNFLEKIDCSRGEIGPNQLSSANFNTWLRNWKEGRIGRRTERYTFVISDNQKIELKDVVEGLDAQQWDPAVRDKTFMLVSSCEQLVPSYVAVMDDAMDITNVRGRIGSVKVSRNELLFIVWWWSGSGFQCRFPTKQQLEELEGWLEHYEEKLEEKLETRNRLIGMIEEDEEVKRDLEKVEEEIRGIEEKLKEIKEQLEKFYNEYV